MREVSQRTTELSYPLFDWLRFSVASLVALSHHKVIGWAPAADFAVQIFFALSGWLIGGILLRTRRERLPRFFFNRGVRIWIPYVLAVAAIYGLGFLRDGANQDFTRFLIYDLTFVHNWFMPATPEVLGAMPLQGTGSHFWSISVEEQFYLAAPLLIVLFPLGKKVWVWALIAAIAYSTRSFYSTISLGVLAAVAQHSYGNWHLECGGRAAIWLSLAVLVPLLLTMKEHYRLVSPLVAIATVLAVASYGRRGPVGSFLGGMSYPLYLYHWVGMFAANAMGKYLGINLPSVGWTAYAIAVVVGAIAYIVVDRTIQERRDSFYTPERGKAFTMTAYGLMGAGIIFGLATA